MSGETETRPMGHEARVIPHYEPRYPGWEEFFVDSIGRKKRRCQVKKRHTDPPEQCRMPALKGRNHCRKHPSSVGPENGNFSTGTHSKHWLPSRYRAAYEEAMVDPELTSVKHEMASLKVREVELFARVGTTESGESWRQVRDLAAEAARAGREADVDALMAAVEGLVKVAQRGEAEEATWRQLIDVYRLKKDLASVHARREKTLEQYMPGSEAMALLGYVLDVGVQALKEQWAVSRYTQQVQRALSERYPEG